MRSEDYALEIMETAMGSAYLTRLILELDIIQAVVRELPRMHVGRSGRAHRSIRSLQQQPDRALAAMITDAIPRYP